MQEEVVYQIDENDRIIFINHAWLDFAKANQGAHLSAQAVLGRCLWDFVGDAETRHLHQALLKKVRAGAALRNLPFRCDSPDTRRYLEMDILALQAGKVEYRCRTLRLEHRPPVAFVSAPQSESSSFLRMCSWCKKVDAGKGNWLEVEEAVAKLELFDGPSLPPITHTMCDACLRQLSDEE